MAASLVLSALVSVSFAQYIIVENYQSTQDYYLTFLLHNIDPSSCGDSISEVYVLENQQWRAKDQQYDEAEGYRVAWNYNNIKFSDMIPISVRISMTSGRNIDLWGIITTISDTSASFTSAETICDGTFSPTAPSVAPTTASPTAPTTPYPTAASICISDDNLQWKSYNNQIYLNGNRFNMKGLSWFGFETTNYGLYGLDQHNVNWYLDWMIERGFNAIRLPFSQAFMNNAGNRQEYKALVHAAGQKGLLVMPDFHSKSAGAYTEGYYDLDYNQAISTWETVADLLKDEYNVFIADCFNEPHDVSNDDWGDWVSFCEDVAAAIWTKGVNWMVAIEGTNWQCSVISCAWGENLEGVANKNITFDLTSYGRDRFIWSPHVYGGDVTGNYQYSEAAWKAHWGYLVDGSRPSNRAASVIGEFGTKYDSTTMQDWLDDLITYLIKIDQKNTFFWCLNPNSGDTGGVLESDWTTEETGKLAALDRLQPNPSKIVYNNSTKRLCISNLGDENTGTAVPTQANITPSPITPAPVTPSPVTPAPITPSPITPAPVTPAPVTPAPITPAPVTPAPITPAPVTPAPVTPAPVTPAPVTPARITPSPITPAPVTPAPITPVPVTPSPITPAPVTPSPVTPAPITPVPITPAPVTPSPITPSPTTPAHITPAPVTPAPTTPSPVTLAPITPSPVTTTARPTTFDPTTSAPTTENPTTSMPTTDAPTTKAPTTVEPTTGNPTTNEPTIVSSSPTMVPTQYPTGNTAYPTNVPTMEPTMEPITGSNNDDAAYRVYGLWMVVILSAFIGIGLEI